MATGGISDIDRGTDETFDILCSVCKGKNKNTEAEKFCSDCNDYYCSKCVKCHADIPALKNHKILDKAQLHLGSSVKFPAVPTEMCKLHRHKPVDMYCRNHDVVACSACMLVKHSVCKDKFYVPDFIKNSSNIPKSTDTAEQLDIIAKQLSMLHKTFITEKEKLKSSKENSLKQIYKFNNEINKLLDKLEKSTIQKLNRQFQFLHDKIESALKEIQVLTNEVKASQDMLKSTGVNKAQNFISVKTAQATAGHAKVKSDTIQCHHFSAEISFMANQRLKTLLNDLQILGDITLTDKLLSQPSSLDSRQQISNTQTILKTDDRLSRSSLLQIRGSRKYNVKVKSDKNTCNILSACTLDDGTIILSDYENRKLKRVDPETYIVRDCCDVPGRPHQACVISYTEVAIGCGCSKLIQFVSVTRTMNRTRQIKTGHYCSGLACAQEKLFVSETNAVFVYTVSGEKLQQFCLDILGSSHLAVSKSNFKIYVASHDKGLIILDRNGLSIGEFNDPELNSAYDVCLHSDSVLVCGFLSKNILQFSPNGKLIGEVMKTDKCYQAIYSDKNNSKLIVSFLYDDEIEVYDING